MYMPSWLGNKKVHAFLYRIGFYHRFCKHWGEKSGCVWYGIEYEGCFAGDMCRWFEFPWRKK